MANKAEAAEQIWYEGTGSRPGYYITDKELNIHGPFNPRAQAERHVRFNRTETDSCICDLCWSRETEEHQAKRSIAISN